MTLSSYENESGMRSRSMLGISDLLNSDESPPLDPPSNNSEPKSPASFDSAPSKSYSGTHKVGKTLPRSRVHPSLLKDKKLVDIALRHKSGSKRQGTHFSLESGSSKLHLKSLEAGLRVRLILCPSLYELFQQLTPHTSRRNSLYHINYDEDKRCLQGTDISDELKDAMTHKSRKSASNSTPSSVSSYSNGFSNTSPSDSSAVATPLGGESANGDSNGEGDMGFYNDNGLNNGMRNDINNKIRKDINNGIKNGVSGAFAEGARSENGSTTSGIENLTPDSTESSKSNGSGSDISSDTDIKKESIEAGSEDGSSGFGSKSVSRSSSTSGSNFDSYFKYSHPQTHSHLLGNNPVGSRKPVSKRVRLIDNNLVNLAGVSRKVLKSFQVGRDKAAPPTPASLSDGQESDDSRPGILTTFNLLDTAVMSLFGTRTYSIVRVTRSSSSTSDGSVLLKLECAKPGDTRLVDDKEFLEDMAASLGKPGQTPNNLFIKKIVARPRYKSDMKIYIIPTSKKVSLYVDRRDFERDLINGVIELDNPPDRYIYTTFPVDDIIASVRDLVNKSAAFSDVDPTMNVPNHMTGGADYRSEARWPCSAEPESASSTSTSSLPSLTSNTASSASTGSVSSGSDPSSETTPGSDRFRKNIQSIPNAKMNSAEEPGELRFDTSYLA